MEKYVCEGKQEESNSCAFVMCDREGIGKLPYVKQS